MLNSSNPSRSLNVRQRLKNIFFNFFVNWADRRQRAADTHRLSYKNIFVFPTQRGFFFIALIIVLWVLGTNYQNNLILALTFFMVSLFVVSIHLTFFNLRGVTLIYRAHGDAFAKHAFSLSFDIESTKQHFSEVIQFSWRDQQQSPSIYTFSPKGKTSIKLSCLIPQRGHRALPSMCVETSFPLGLIRCWTWLRWQQHILVYPEAIAGVLATSEHSRGDGHDLQRRKGGDDIHDFRRYQAGDNINAMYWKAYARGQGLMVKETEYAVSEDIWLDFSVISSGSIEQKLSLLCHGVLHFEQQNIAYGLILPGQKITPSYGLDHRHHCLKALAEF